jgi:hypothetical protein
MNPIIPARIRIYHWIQLALKMVFLSTEEALKRAFPTGAAAASRQFRPTTHFGYNRGAAFWCRNPHALWAQQPTGGSEVNG